MTYNNDNGQEPNRLERLIESNARAIQALTESLPALRQTTERVVELTEAVVTMLARQDETNPTILARLNRIEGKVDQLLERQQPPQE